MTSTSLLISLLTLLKVDKNAHCFTLNSITRSEGVKSSLLNHGVTVLNYGDRTEEHGPEQEIETEELQAYFSDEEPQATTSQHYLSSISGDKPPLSFTTSPESVRDTIEDLNFQRSELETFEAAARMDSSSDDDVADAIADESTADATLQSVDVVKRYSYKSPFSGKLNTQRSHALHTHRQTYSYTYSPSGNSINSTDIPSVKDLIVPLEDEENVIYAGFFEDFAKVTGTLDEPEGIQNTIDTSSVIPKTQVKKTINYSYEATGPRKVQYPPPSIWKMPLPKSSYRTTPLPKVEDSTPKKSYFYSKSISPNGSITALGNSYLQSCGTISIHPEVQESKSVQVQACELKKSYLKSIMTSYSKKIQNDETPIVILEEPVVMDEIRIYPAFSSVQTTQGNELKAKFTESIKTSLVSKHIETQDDTIVTPLGYIALPSEFKIHPDFSSVNSKNAYIQSIKDSLTIPQDTIQLKTIEYSPPLERIYPDFSFVQSDKVKNKYIQSLKNSLAECPDVTNPIEVMMHEGTSDEFKIYPAFSTILSQADFSFVQSNKVKNKYVQSLKNSLAECPDVTNPIEVMMQEGTSDEFKIYPAFLTVLSQAEDRKKKYLQSIKNSLSTKIEDVTNDQLEAVMSAYTTTLEELKVYPDFSSVKADEVNNIYLESIKNALLVKKPNNISNGHTIKPPATECIEPIVININPALMSKKAEQIVLEITRQIEAMENQDKDMKKEAHVATVQRQIEREIESLGKKVMNEEEFQSKVSSLFATVDKLAESSTGIFNDSVLSMNKAFDGAKDYLKNVVPPMKMGKLSIDISSTPGAKLLAKKIGLDLDRVKGTGKFGRVTADDVKLASNPRNVDDAEKKGVVPFTPMQRGISKNMEASLSTPVFRLTRKIDMEKFDKLYHKLKKDGVSVSSLLAKAVAVCIEKHPIMNSSYKNGGIHYNKDINISMAVAIGGGLYTPTLRNANEKNVFELGSEWRTLVRKAKKNKLTPEESTTATFAISNLGMFGVKSFDAVLPPGLGCILAIASTQPIVLPDKKSSSGSRVMKKMSVTITCDHRNIYGADAAKFLQTLADVLENNVDSLED